ncbi:MAG: hypothetical protein GY803_25505 [Chloroflexi bacterium]|nr:hypothetical protein [Chloroflexota bacterium]
MKQATGKSATQMLFERLLTTWIEPEVEKRASQGLIVTPVLLGMVLIVWENLDEPRIFLNTDVADSVDEVSPIMDPALLPGEPVFESMIYGLRDVTLSKHFRNYPFVFVMRGAKEKYYVVSQKMYQVIGTKDFEVLRDPLAKNGVYIITGENQVRLFLDVIRNYYDGLSSPALKRQETIRLAKTMVDSVRQTATDRVKRHLKLPPLFVFQDDEFLPLLLEARQTYIDGYFFSSIATAATTADRICIRLSEHYELQKSFRKWVLDQTLGNKISKLRAEGVLTEGQEELLIKINKIRVRHLHPRKSMNEITLKRDAFKSVFLLHQLLEGTFSVYRDHTFLQGRIVPKPLV